MTSNSNRNPGSIDISNKSLANIFARIRFVIVAAAFFSALINLLMLTGSFYMLEVYDRVIPSRSIPTLVVLSVLALGLFISQGILEVIRSRIFIRIGNYLEDTTSEQIFQLIARKSYSASPKSSALQPMRDMDAIKGFLSSGGPGALLDLPWIPIYVGVMFIFHWMIGLAAVVGAIILVGLTLWTEYRTRKPTTDMTRDLAIKADIAISGQRNAEVIASMGMAPRLAQRYKSAGLIAAQSQTMLSDLAGGMSSISRVCRMVMQSGILGLGALLVIWNESSAGIIIAASILFGRALAPIDQAIANWKGLVAARQGWQRLADALKQTSVIQKKMQLPAPIQFLRVEQLAILEPDAQRFLIRDISFQLKAGENLCVIGASGAGKSTLARALVNSWKPVSGRIELDGATLDQWPIEDLGNHIGYLPQDVELMSGTIAENISRYQPDAAPSSVIEAAQATSVHGLITKLKDGYQTQVGEAGGVLSAGQRQRIGLARAFYGNPFLIVLDEPNSNLDWEGDVALRKAILSVKERKGIVVAISHRPTLLDCFDFVLIMKAGQVVAFGPRDEIIAKHLRNNQSSGESHIQNLNSVVTTDKPNATVREAASP